MQQSAVLQDTGQYQETFYLSAEGFTKQLKKILFTMKSQIFTQAVQSAGIHLQLR